MVLIVDTYHHLPNRVVYLTELRRQMKPAARLAIVDFRKGAPDGPPDEFRFTPAQISRNSSRQDLPSLRRTTSCRVSTSSCIE